MMILAMRIPPGADMKISGCTQGFIWCDVAWNGNRGWIAGRFLDGSLDDGSPLGRIECHVARPNAQWRDFAADTDALMIGFRPDSNPGGDSRCDEFDRIAQQVGKALGQRRVVPQHKRQGALDHDLCGRRLKVGIRF